ncbi:MAG TPA: GNAT family N-acetyltransferase [Vicinamibacterales bacterium]|jgi:predicted N-acetyltransferase YhbS|nr:GNAT family N-acetyltransferase [Vicinamibacterales bacterium]
MRVVLADEPLIERVLDDTFPVWHEGLSREAYSKWSRGQLRTPWGREHLQRFALLDDAGTHVASLKRYRLPVRVDGRDGWMCGIGAVLTVPEHRGAGHASRLVEQVLDQSRREGALLAGLFSEIGVTFYERLGFSPVALDEVTVRVTRRKGAAMTLVRFGDDRDLPAIAALHAVRSADARFALRRDTPLVHYAIAKKRLFAGLSTPGTRQLEFFVAEEGVSAVAYAVLSQNQYGWTLEEAGDRDPAGARLGAMFEVLLAREPSLGDPIIRAWWPRGFPAPPQLTLSNRTDPKDVFMVRPLADGIEVPPGPDGVFWWRSDYF